MLFTNSLATDELHRHSGTGFLPRPAPDLERHPVIHLSNKLLGFLTDVP